MKFLRLVKLITTPAQLSIELVW